MPVHLVAPFYFDLKKGALKIRRKHTETPSDAGSASIFYRTVQKYCRHKYDVMGETMYELIAIYLGVSQYGMYSAFDIEFKSTYYRRKLFKIDI